VAEKTKIAWTDSTFNPWKICTPVGPGCNNCYAAALSPRYGWGEYAQGVPRQRTTEAYWKQPLKWDRARGLAIRAHMADQGHTPFPEPHRVFCASLADVFDNEVPAQWRADLWDLIFATPNLSWLLVTKRIGNVERMAAEAMPASERPGPFPPNVRLIITVCNQEEADRDIPKLLALPCKNGVSYEPALARVDWCEALGIWWNSTTKLWEKDAGRFVEWIIVGGESTQGAGKARPFDREWAYSTIRQCKAAGVPCFVKQLGSNVRARNDEHGCDVYAPRFLQRAGADPAEWAEDLRVQCFPE